MVSSPAKGDANTQFLVIKDSKTYGQIKRASSAISALGWLIGASAEAAYSREDFFGTKDLLYLLHYDSIFGYEGWGTDLPGLTEEAQRMIATCDDSFFQTYGTYFVAGQTNGNALDVKVQVTAKSEYSKSSVDSQLSIGWGSDIFGAAGTSFIDSL